MSIANLNYKNVTVFPIAKERASEAPNNRAITEESMSNMTRQLFCSGSSGFIISYESDGSSFSIEFNLYGYYFKLTDISISDLYKKLDKPSEIYAYIVIDSTNKEISMGDDTTSGQYKGLTLSSEEPDSNDPNIKNIKYMKLFNCTANGTSVSLSPARVGFITSLIGGIDGKH